METSMEEGDCLSQENETWNDELDMSQLCRICANPNEYLIPIFFGEGQEHELETKIAKHLPIKVKESDELPTNLCYQCASTLIAWHDMVEGFVEADEKLKTMSSYKTGKYTKATSKSINKDNQTESCIDPQDQNIPLKKINAMAHISQGQDKKPLTSVEKEEIAIEEETTSVKPGMMEEESTDSRCVEMEDMDYYDDDSDEELEDELLTDLESDEEYGTLYNCNICKAANMALRDFLSHTKLHTKDEKQKALTRILNTKIIKEEAAKSAAASFGFRVQDSLESSVTLYQCIVCGQGNLLLKSVKDHSSIHPHYLESHFCNICQKHFPSHKCLTLHLEVHLDNNDLICQYCNKRFEMIDELEAHEDLHYQAEYACVDCRESFKSKELVLIHLKNLHSKDTSCLICDVEFKSEQVIAKHFISHAVVRAVKRLLCSFICDLCGKKYDSKVSLQRHKLFLHNDRLPFICEDCGFFAFHEIPMKEHLENKHGEKEDSCVCARCGTDDNEPARVVQQIAKAVNKCKFCGLTFNLRVQLKHHLKSHGELRNTDSFPKAQQIEPVPKKESPLACSCCGELFTADDLCVTHSLYHVDSVLCDLCGKPFKSEFDLNLHLNDVHANKCYKHDKENGIFPFRCKHCSLTFKLEFEYEDHCEIHEHVRYECHFCFKEFTADQDLQEHLNSHDEENES